MTKCKRTRVEDIVFSEHDTRGVKHPFDDPLVIMLAILGYNTCWVLFNNRSSANIMCLTAFQQMKINPKRLCPFESPLVSFSRDRVYLKWIISLSITIGTCPTQVTRNIDFLIDDCPSSYNFISGWPTANRLKNLLLRHTVSKSNFQLTTG